MLIEAGFPYLQQEANNRVLGEAGERFIEVKTTGFGKEVPFWVTARELAVSRSEEDRYHLYRAFSFRRDPRLFIKQGALDRVSLLEPETFRGWVG